MTIHWRRVPFVGLGMLSLLLGLLAALVRLGFALPSPHPELMGAHGPLMIVGFVGTLIALERAVAAARPWAYAAPVLLASSALASIVAWPWAPSLALLGSAVVVAVSVWAWRKDSALHVGTMAVAAFCFALANAGRVIGLPLHGIVGGWLAFLVLTIASERLELSRVLPKKTSQRLWFVSGAVLLVGGAITTPWQGTWGGRIVGLALVVLAAWLVRHDVARRTIKLSGLPRFIAFCLLSGYGWLAVGGLALLVVGLPGPGPLYDAALHAVFVGFVMTMIFAHAPIIFPAILGRAMGYRPRFYAPVLLSHAALVVRLVGDFSGDYPLRQWASAANVVALLSFVVSTVVAIIQPARRAEV